MIRNRVVRMQVRAIRAIRWTHALDVAQIDRLRQPKQQAAPWLEPQEREFLLRQVLEARPLVVAQRDRLAQPELRGRRVRLEPRE